MNVGAVANWVSLPWIASHPIAYPALVVVHIVGIALLVGSLFLLELRVWGLGAELPIRPLAKLALSVTVTGFSMAVVSGVLMFMGNPAELLSNRAFLIKLALVHLAGLNAAWFHGGDGLARCDGLARTQTLVSMGLWFGVIVCGRWIAYL